MRKDMAKVIVTHPRILDSTARKGRTVPEEAQVGRAVYSEVAANLRPTSTVQQHVRDHLWDFVNPRRQPGRYGGYAGRPWYEPLYVDARGILRRTDELPEVRAAQRRRQLWPGTGGPQSLRNARTRSSWFGSRTGSGSGTQILSWKGALVCAPVRRRPFRNSFRRGQQGAHRAHAPRVRDSHGERNRVEPGHRRQQGGSL